MNPKQADLSDTWMPDKPSRYLLWIDGVGGFLVCLAARVSLGQDAGEAAPDVPILANVARRHATLLRDGEGYCLEAHRPVSVNGDRVERALLRSGDRVTLGSTCQFLFTKPVPLSNSARLELVSGQRLVHPVNAVLLMAETLVLGPGLQAHVAVDELRQPIVLYRPKEGLGIRYGGPLSINGEPRKDRGNLGREARVQTDAVALALRSVPV